jgi:23S rRNA pseudouridine1911/1915/1917 synthase
MFEERASVDKHYLAITWGWPEEDAFRSDLPLELDPTSRYKVKMRIAQPGTGLGARTGFEVLGRRANPVTGRRYALVRCHLETGRQHQIRIHLAERGHPLLGEKVYLRDYDGPKIAAPRTMLHARTLGFTHPRSGSRVSYEREPPEDFAYLVASASFSPGT